MRKFLFLVLLTALLLPLARPAPVSAAPPPDRIRPGDGMLDVWVFIDNDRNGVYSSGDYGLTDALVCVDLGKRWNSCVGTDYGDTWWEDLPVGRYLVRVIPATVPAGYRLNAIRCEETISRAEYKGCRYMPNKWAAFINLQKGKRLNVFFALVPN